MYVSVCTGHALWCALFDGTCEFGTPSKSIFGRMSRFFLDILISQISQSYNRACANIALAAGWINFRTDLLS